jgi:outer membrane protein W
MERLAVLPRNSVVFATGAALLTAALLPSALAADLTKKWRFSLAAGVPPIGGYNSQDEIESSSGNRLFIVPDCLRTNTCSGAELEDVDVFLDPREESSVFGSLEVRPMSMATFAVQYGVSKRFLLEGSIGYQKSEIGDIEFSAQFVGDGPEDEAIEGFNFTPHHVPAGDLSVIPISITAMAHFRPRATFDPYIGAGVGYWVIGFDVNPELDVISQLMDSARGEQIRLSPSGSLIPTGFSSDLQGATVDARDSFAWHLAGGAELSFKKRWSAFMDLRWVDVSKDVSVGFNGSTELGTSVPNFVDFQSSERANTLYGPVQIGNCQKTGDPSGDLLNCTGGGLIDLGQAVLLPTEDAPLNTDCTDPADALTPNCQINFVFEPDGIPDPGMYYAQGGSFSYDGFSLQLGVRFTFGK